MDCCKHCGSKNGFYTKNQYKGSGIYLFNFDGRLADNGSMYDCLTNIQSKYVYCQSCDKRLFKTEDIQLDY